MADRTVSVRLALKNDGFIAGIKQADKQAKDFAHGIRTNAEKNKADLDKVSGALGGVGLAAGAAFGLAVKKFADFDAGMSKVRAATHETAGNMAELRDAAIEAGAKTKFSATEAAAGIENLAKAGVSTKDILGGGLAGALDLAAAGELGVADAAEVAATAMTQFKLQGKDVPHIADLLAAGAGKAQGEVSDMAQALNQSGLVASQFGLSIEETTGTLGAFASAGLLGSDAGTSFKTMLLQLANPSKQSAAAMKELGIHAYDAQGAFVGIAPLAEQLKTKLGSLTQEQRDSTLATIFGSDAIRAANVLYTNGAKGVVDWTTKVNDAGYAAETAAIKQDNLRGDIEKLGGSLETALIKTGEGADGALRKLTQSAADAVNAFADLPPQAQQAALGIAGVTAVTALSAAGMIKVVTVASEVKTALENLGSAGRKLTLSMGAVGIALAAAGALYVAFSKHNEEAEQKVDDLRGTLDQQTGAITQNTRAYVANELAQSGLAQKAKGLGLDLSKVTDAALGNKGALDSLVDSLNKTIDASNLAALNGTANTDQSLKNADAAEKLRDELLGMNGALSDAQTKQKLAAEGASENTTAQDALKAAVAKANEKIQAEAQSLEDQIDAMHRASTAALTLSGSQIAVEAAIDDAAAAAAKNGRTVDKHTGQLAINTEKQRANRSALNDVAAAANAQTDAMRRNGSSQAAAAAKVETSRAAFSTLAQKMGLSKTQADKLAASLIDLPPKVDTQVTNNAPAAKKPVDAYQTALANNPKTKDTNFKTKGIPTAKKEVIDFATHVDKTLGGIADETVNIKTNFITAKIVADSQRKAVEKNLDRRGIPVGYATGGPVFGAGTSTSDSIPALLSNDEHVWTAKEVKAAGGHDAVKEMREHALQGYATGGAVSIRPNMRFGGIQAEVDRIEATTHKLATAYGKTLQSLATAESNKLIPDVGPGGPPGKVQNFRGKRLNARTIGMLLQAEDILGRQFHITQGSYSTSVAASGSTHAGGGVMDTDGPGGWGNAQSALRRVGFAAWHRTPAQGPWGHHIHSVAIGDSSESAAARRQVQSYLRGGDGLGHGMAAGGPVKALSFDNGGLLPTGPSVVVNGTGRPEPVGHDFLRKSDLAGMQFPLTITNWDKGTGYIRLVAQDVVDASGEFASTTGRMN